MAFCVEFCVELHLFQAQAEEKPAITLLPVPILKSLGIP